MVAFDFSISLIFSLWMGVVAGPRTLGYDITSLLSIKI
jgi:hypothetical protein